MRLRAGEVRLLCRDYVPMDTLDRYDANDLDQVCVCFSSLFANNHHLVQREYAPLDAEARAAAEAELDRREGRASRVDRAFRDDDDAELDTTHRERRQYDDEEEVG